VCAAVKNGGFAGKSEVAFEILTSYLISGTILRAPSVGRPAPPGPCGE